MSHHKWIRHTHTHTHIVCYTGTLPTEPYPQLHTYKDLVNFTFYSAYSSVHMLFFCCALSSLWTE